MKQILVLTCTVILLIISSNIGVSANGLNKNQDNLFLDFTNQTVITTHEFINCDNLTINGGIFSAPLKLVNCKNVTITNVTFSDIGNQQSEDTQALALYGDCTGFTIDNCVFDNISAGVVSPDGFIHSYGIVVNRLNSDKSYSANGTISNCTFTNIYTYDTDGIKGDGDAIFIQAPPYTSDGDVITPVSNIVVDNCYFKNCKKRGVKLACVGATVQNCTFDGAYWLACVELQYGWCNVVNCNLTNTSDYTKSVTSCIVVDDGGFTIDSCTMSAPYVDVNDKQQYHPGIRFNNRLSSNIYTQDVPWWECVIIDCYFDQVSRAIYAYDSNPNPTTYVLDGLTIKDCSIGRYNQKYGIELLKSRFSEIKKIVNNTNITIGGRE